MDPDEVFLAGHHVLGRILLMLLFLNFSYDRADLHWWIFEGSHQSLPFRLHLGISRLALVVSQALGLRSFEISLGLLVDSSFSEKLILLGMNPCAVQVAVSDWFP